jgi:hypothetical protein
LARVCRRISASASTSFGLSTATRTRSPPALADGLGLLDGGVDVLGARGAHALDGDGVL